MKYPWRHRENQTHEFTVKDRDFIRTLVAKWDTAESGAPALIHPNGDDLEYEVCTPVEIFLNTAKLEAKSYAFANPYWKNEKLSDELAAFLEEFPEENVRKIFRENKDVNYTPDPQEIDLWGRANFNWNGIDVKEPWQGKKYTAKVRSRLVVALQALVSTAEIPLGPYFRESATLWEPGSPKAELIDADEWNHRMASIIAQSFYVLQSDFGNYFDKKKDGLEKFRETFRGIIDYRNLLRPALEESVKLFPENTRYRIYLARLLNLHEEFSAAEKLLKGISTEHSLEAILVDCERNLGGKSVDVKELKVFRKKCPQIETDDELLICLDSAILQSEVMSSRRK